jgi:hypothetical protein
MGPGYTGPRRAVQIPGRRGPPLPTPAGGRVRPDMDDDEHDPSAVRRSRERRLAEATRKRPGGFLSSPYAALTLKALAIGAVVAFWLGAPQWVFLALAVGALGVIVLGPLRTLARRKGGDEP